ncbi:MAG: hypothetical protein U0414_21890 [Polyangiaceae bacterium]
MANSRKSDSAEPSTSPQFCFGATDVTALMAHVEGAAFVNPGSRARVLFTRRAPIPLGIGMRFAVREGGKTMGAGAVTAVGAKTT